MAKKASVPKRIAGVKIPKALRKSLKQLAASEDGKKRIVEALASVGAVLAAIKAQPGSTARSPAPKTGPKLKGALGEGAAKISATGEQMAREARALVEGLKDSAPATAGAAAPIAGDPA